MSIILYKTLIINNNYINHIKDPKYIITNQEKTVGLVLNLITRYLRLFFTLLFFLLHISLPLCQMVGNAIMVLMTNVMIGL